jgi:hypothetical protein
MAGDRTLTDREQIAANVLAFGKALTPDRFPKPTPIALQAWALVLGEVRVPSGVWPEAIAWWSMNSVGERMATPRELKEAALHIIRDVWETDPEKRRILEEHRAARLRRREALGELPPGTAPETPGDGQQAAIEPRREETAGRWKELRAGITARAQARHEAERHNNPPETAEEGA